MILGICLQCKKEFRKRERKRKFCSLICSNNFNRNGLKEMSLPTYSDKLAEFIGICLGDGCVSGYQVSVTLNKNADRDYIPYVRSLMVNLFPEVKVSLIEKRKDNAVDVRLYSKQIVDFLKKMGIISNKKAIPKWILSRKTYTFSCVRGLFDTEGSISFKKYISKGGLRLYPQLNFRNTNHDLLLLVRDVLLAIGLRPTQTFNNSIYISNGEDIKRVLSTIGFGNPKLIDKVLHLS